MQGGKLIWVHVRAQDYYESLEEVCWSYLMSFEATSRCR